MWGMFVSVTGGMSLVDGGRWPEVAVAVVCGTMPVLMIGGVSSVEMALLLCSLTAPMVLLKPLSSEPPTECIEDAVEPRRGL